MTNPTATADDLLDARARRARLEPHLWRLRPEAARRVLGVYTDRITALERELGCEPEILEDLPLEDAEPVPPTPVLVLREGLPDERRIRLERGVQIGRGRASDVRVRDDCKASRLHCRIEPIGEEWVVTDLASANGTLVNGDLISRPTRLYGGEELIVGASFLRFLLVATG